MMPGKSEILEKAVQLWFEDQYKHGFQPSINPEPSELAEGGFIVAAQSELMRSTDRSRPEWDNYIKTTENVKEPLSENFDKILDVDALMRSGLTVFGGSGCGKSTLAKAVVRKLAQKGIVSYVLDPSRAWLDQNFEVIEVTKDQDSYRWTGNTVFDVSRLTNDQKMIFADLLAGSLMNGHLNGVKQREILVMEESELYLSNNSLRSKRLENVLTLVSNGRNFGLRFIAVSQVPSMIDKLPIKLCEQRFFGRLSEPNDQRYCKQLLGKTWVEELKALQVGEFISENKGKVQRFKLETKTEPKPKQFNFTYQYGCSQ